MDEYRVVLTDYYAANRQSLVDEATRLLHGDVMTAEDVVQTTFLRLFAQLSSPRLPIISTPQLLNSLVHTTMLNLLRDLWRHRQHRQEYERQITINGGKYADDTFSVCSAHQITELLEHRIARMDESVSQVLRMNIIEEKAVSEIAEELQIKYKTIENRLQTGRKQLRSFIRKAV